MEIVWLGHSCVMIKTTESTLITDPFPDSIGIRMPELKSDVVTISNSHPNHSFIDSKSQYDHVIDGPGEYEIAGYYITGIGTPLNANDESDHINTIYSIRAEGLTITHLGDISQSLSPSQAQELDQTDVLIVPAGGVCTLDIPKIAELANRISPRIIIPVHYKVEGSNIELAPLDDFMRHMGAGEVVPQLRLNVTATNLPKETRISVIQRSI